MSPQLGYRPNLMARNLRTEQSYTIGVISDDCCVVMDSKLLI